MLTLSNGHSFQFCCSAGALGFDGDGYWWEQPLRWLGVLRPREFTIITKTITCCPRAGNYRWFSPWRTVRPIKGGLINAMGLPNMGFRGWVEKIYPRIARRGYHVVVSIRPTNWQETFWMINSLNLLDIRGIELNLSCPNADEDIDVMDVLRAAHETSKHPIIAKVDGSATAIANAVPFVEAFDLINAVPWSVLYPERKSPLGKLGGGVSGPVIRHWARGALRLAKTITDKPIISGGGIEDVEECLERERLGAVAFSLGSLFLRKPWRPNQIIEQYNKLPRR